MRGHPSFAKEGIFPPFKIAHYSGLAMWGVDDSPRSSVSTLRAINIGKALSLSVKEVRVRTLSRFLEDVSAQHFAIWYTACLRLAGVLTETA